MLIPSLKDYVYKFITESIQQGTLKANDKINEATIVNALNVSRTPVREALIQLEADGFLQSYPRRGFFIKPITEQEARDLYAVIGQLDAFAAELAIDYLELLDLEKLSSLHHLMQEAIDTKDYREYYRLQIEFHNIYINKSNNPTLIDTLNRLRRRFIRQSYGENNIEAFGEYLTSANKQHEEIVNLLKSKDIEKLKKLLIQDHWALHYAELDSF